MNPNAAGALFCDLRGREEPLQPAGLPGRVHEGGVAGNRERVLLRAVRQEGGHRQAPRRQETAANPRHPT